ncbi:MAG: hypothetical protein AMXMBFR84_50350 [Candidatus Hydrogenedentota bacterium]
MVVNLIIYAIPVFFLLIGVELIVCWIAKRQYYRFNDTINDLSMGTVDQIGGAFLKSIVFVGYLYIYENHRLFDIPDQSIVAGAACLLFYDLMYYWAHRASHEINVIWGSHIPHHQSEEYNLSVALRQGVFQGCFFWIFYLPLAWTGFSPWLFLLMAQIDTLYQFWIHTRTVGKLGPLEWFLNTPSHHRVHHGKNPKYIDKNHGGILIIWDRLFGSFQEEEEEPLYGTATPLRSWNPVWGQIHYWIDLGRLAAQAPRWRDKALIWFMKPAWRPEGMKKHTPAYLTKAFYEKYDARVPLGVSLYVLSQFVPSLLAGTLFLASERDMALPEKTAIGALLVLSLTVAGGLLESKRWAFRFELVRVPVALAMAGYYALLFVGDGTAAIGIAVGLVLTWALWTGWLLRYRRVFTRDAGSVPWDEQSVVPVESERRADVNIVDSEELAPAK